MYLKYYKNLTYWKKYLPFLPQKYQAQFETPNEAYWDWKTAKIHLDYKIKKTSKITVILIHGAGGNGRILSMFTSFLIANDINYYAPDNLGYGLTQLSNKRFVYDDWVDMLSDFTKYVIQKEDTLVVLIGMSVGGMLAYQVASRVKAVRGVIVTTFADPRDQDTMVAMSKNKFLGTVGLQLGKTFKVVSDGIWVPIKWLCKLNLMSRDPQFSKIFMEDKHAGGILISMRFLRTFSTYQPAQSFDQFDTCPLLLIHPEKDDWTPFHLSKKNFDQLRVEKEVHLLKECGHAPIEVPGIFEMETQILQFLKKVL